MQQDFTRSNPPKTLGTRVSWLPKCPLCGDSTIIIIIVNTYAVVLSLNPAKCAVLTDTASCKKCMGCHAQV